MSTYRRSSRLATLGAVCALASGCTTYQTVRFESDPPGAEIVVNGTPLGPAPVSKALLVDAAGVHVKDRNHTVEARKTCYLPEQAVLQSDSVNWSNDKPYPDTVTLRLTPDPRCRTARAAPAGRQAPRNEPIATGSGFFVSTDGLVVTNHHVIEGCSRVRVPPSDAAVVSSDPYYDLALLRVSRPGTDVGVLREGRGVRPGDDIVVIGYPLRGVLATEPNVTTGTISALSGRRNDRRIFQMSAPIQPGNSGGPVLDLSGHIVGTSVGTLSTLGLAEAIGSIPQNVNFAITANSLRSFLDAAGVAYKTAPSETTGTAADVAAKARSYTAVVECWE